MASRKIRLLFCLVMVTTGTTVLFIQFFHKLMTNTSFRWAAFSSGPTENKGSLKIDLAVGEDDGERSARPARPGPAEGLGAAAETPMPVLLKSSFTKLPRWDFEDVYAEDPPQRPTTCERSLRNSKDERFRRAFLANIRLYLHQDNMNTSEWNRLSHFNNPFGFMEYEHDEVMPTLKLIPKPEGPLLQPKAGGDGCASCAVVGNGGILYGSEKGAEIDAHDYVFRMNGAVTAGFEGDVGRRTSVYVHTAYSLKTSLSTLREFGYKAAPHDEGIKYVMIPEQKSDFQWLEGLLKGERVSSGPFMDELPRSHYSGQYNKFRFYVLHQDFLRYVRNRFLKSENLNRTFWSIVRPTSGAFTLFLALHTCDTVSAYGFMTDDHAKYANYYVERLNGTKVTFFDKHDYLLEKDTWKRLHDSNIIRLYQRTEGPKPTPTHRERQPRHTGGTLI